MTRRRRRRLGRVTRQELDRLREDFLAAIQDEHVICLECGRRLRMLGGHLQHAHQITLDEYRERWGYNASYGLVCNELRRRQRQRMLSWIENIVGWERHRSLSRKRIKIANASRPEKIEYRAQAIRSFRAGAGRKASFDREQATRLAERGLKPAEIASLLGCSVGTVRKFQLRAGLRRPDPRIKPKTLSERRLFAELRAGLSPEEIAKRHGLGFKNLNRRLNRLLEKREMCEVDSPRLQRLRRNPGSTVHRDHVECLVCGSRSNGLKTHLKGHGLSVERYRVRYGLSPELVLPLGYPRRKNRRRQR